jgi:hypothetical protein
MARRAMEWLDALAETWQKTDLVEEKSDVIHAVYERIVIEGPRFVGLRLTPAAYRHGLALELPDAAMARPAEAPVGAIWPIPKGIAVGVRSGATHILALHPNLISRSAGYVCPNTMKPIVSSCPVGWSTDVHELSPGFFDAVMRVFQWAWVPSRSRATFSGLVASQGPARSGTTVASVSSLRTVSLEYRTRPRSRSRAGG